MGMKRSGSQKSGGSTPLTNTVRRDGVRECQFEVQRACPFSLWNKGVALEEPFSVWVEFPQETFDLSESECRERMYALTAQGLTAMKARGFRYPVLSYVPSVCAHMGRLIE